MTWSLRMRLAAISTIVFGLLLAGLSVVSYEVLGRRLDDDVTARLGELTAGLHGYLRFDKTTVSIAFDVNDDDAAAFVHEATRYYQSYDAGTGQLLGESPGIRPLALHLTRGEVEAFHAAPRSFDIETDYGRLRFSNRVGATPDGRKYLLQVGVPLKPMDDALKGYRDLLVWRVPIGFVVAVAASWAVEVRALMPLTRVAAAARRIDVQTLERRLPVRGGGDELDRVVEAFNATLGRLEVSVAHMRQFSAAMAHELRTPLAALRGEIDLAWHAAGVGPEQRERFGRQLEEIDRLTRLIDRILTLARAESGQIKLTRAPVDLAELANRLVEQIEPIAAAKSVELRCEAPAEVVVEGDAGWLERLVLNLVDNAVKFTREHGRVLVRVARGGPGEGDLARIDVEDTGVGLSPEDTRRVFERFFRTDEARSRATEGAGLGLSLVQWIAERHGGDISVRSRLGEGSTFTVTLPGITRDHQAGLKRINAPIIYGSRADDEILIGYRLEHGQRLETLVNIEKRMAGDVMILSLVGDMTLNGAEATMIADKVRSEMVQGQTKFILDLAHVRYIDSAGLGELIHAFAAVKNRGGAMKLINLTKRVNDLLVLTRLLTVFESFDSEEEALASFPAVRASGA